MPKRKMTLEDQKFADESIQSRQAQRRKHGNTHPAAKDRRPLHQSSEVTNATQSATLLKQTDQVEQCGRSDPVIEDLHEHTAQRRLRVDRSANGRGSDCEQTEHAVAEMVD